jgi:hypothetical protein
MDVFFNATRKALPLDIVIIKQEANWFQLREENGRRRLRRS